MKKEIAAILEQEGLKEDQSFLITVDGLDMAILNAEDYVKVRHWGGVLRDHH